MIGSSPETHRSRHGLLQVGKRGAIPAEVAELHTLGTHIITDLDPRQVEGIDIGAVRDTGTTADQDIVEPLPVTAGGNTLLRQVAQWGVQQFGNLRPLPMGCVFQYGFH
jgi:hypothetical protein